MSITKVIPISAASKRQRFRLCAKQSKHLFNFFNSGNFSKSEKLRVIFLSPAL